MKTSEASSRKPQHSPTGQRFPKGTFPLGLITLVMVWVWCWVFPRWSYQSGAEQRIEMQQSMGIDPAALFYTDLPRMLPNAVAGETRETTPPVSRDGAKVK